MPAFVKNLTFDCVDALRLARFWAAALGSDVDEGSTSERAYVEAPAWGGPNIWFRGARDPKAAPNRLHLDLRALTTRPRRSTAWSPSAPPWSSATTTSPSCTTRKATSSASSRVPATPTRHQVADVVDAPVIEAVDSGVDEAGDSTWRTYGLDHGPCV